MRQCILVAVAATMWLATIPALAADGAPDTTAKPAAKGTPEQKARREEWCKANPEKCKEMQARREQCKADPEKCKAERQAKREEWCKANPERCAQTKAKMEERRKQCEANPSSCPHRRPDTAPASK